MSGKEDTLLSDFRVESGVRIAAKRSVNALPSGLREGGFLLCADGDLKRELR